MTDLAARLRELLSDETLLDLLLAAEDYEVEKRSGRTNKTQRMAEFRAEVEKHLLPLLSSLLEEREREIREANAVIRGDSWADTAGEVSAGRERVEDYDVCSRFYVGGR